MIDLGDINYVKQLKADFALAFEGERGERMMEFLSMLCNYDTPGYDPANNTTIFLCAGRREVLMTLKSILKYSPEQIAAFFKKTEIQ